MSRTASATSAGFSRASSIASSGHGGLATTGDDAKEYSIDSSVLNCMASGCDGSNAPYRCSGCQRAFYCNLECQKKHWNDHRNDCKNYKNLMKSHFKSGEWADVEQPTNDTCPVCNKNPIDKPVVLPCNHGYCFKCSMQNVDKTFGVKCGVCSHREADVSSFDRFEELYVDRCLMNAKNKSLMPAQRRDIQGTAMDGLDLLLSEINKNPSDICMDNTEMSITRYMKKKAGLLMDTGNTRESLELFQSTLERMRQSVKSELTSASGSSSTGYDRAREKIDEHGLGCQVFIDMGDTNRAVDLAKTQITMADAYFKLEQWENAIQTFDDIFHVPENQLKSIDNLWMKTQCGKAMCKLKIGDLESGRKLAERATKIDDCTQGVHKPLALAYKQLGDLPMALETMNKGIFYEAPWDKDNIAANTHMWEELHAELQVQRERARLEREFLMRWGSLIEDVKDALPDKDDNDQPLLSWASLKLKRYDMFTGEDEDDIDELQEERDRMVSSAVAALAVPGEESIEELEEDDDVIEKKDGRVIKLAEAEKSKPEFDRFRLTREVRKWWERQGDPKYKEFFVRRLRQLGCGDRSRILQKRLFGSKNITIYETYLEQKSGFRILWTEDNAGILIWYVSPHDKVSTYVKRIDDAQSRSMRQLQTLHEITDMPDLADALDEEGDDDLDADKVLLDPEGDTPLKLHILHYDEIEQFANTPWLPPLYLTSEERKIVEKKGTVLLLGRSGTGKTVCICSRIHYDRHKGEKDTMFSQLFVARSRRICDYVKETVGPATRVGGLDDSKPLTTYFTFSKFVENCESILFGTPPFETRNRVDFSRFKKNFTIRSGVDHLIVWTQIRSFIKGSIESLEVESETKKKGEPLTREQYLDTEMIGSRRSRLTLEERNIAYDEYERYQKFLAEEGLWDDCDRINLLVQKIQSDPDGRLQLSHSRVYVDEVQDYTQLEMALFFLLCKKGGLFLAGDPAQSVVEGVEFRFDEVRGVPHYLYPDNKDFIPDKPRTVTRNFRSHAGILKVAGEVLDRLFRNFPGSAKELPKDRGMFVGPRPTFFRMSGREALPDLVYKIQGLVVLAMNDSDVEGLVEQLGSEIVVLSIRDSKGLEFSDVMIVDFFKNLPRANQKAWKLILKGDEDARKEDGFPEIETHLKQLYTAITRCSKRLFFVETSDSDAGNQFERELTKNKDDPLLMKQSAVDTEGVVKTKDEWNATGVDYGTFAESAEDLSRAIFWLDRALPCFRESCGNEPKLEDKVHAHKKSIVMRQKYRYRSPDDDEDLDKERLAKDLLRLLQDLTDAGLMVEAKQLCGVMVPFLDDDTKNFLTEHLIPILEKVEL